MLQEFASAIEKLEYLKYILQEQEYIKNIDKLLLLLDNETKKKKSTEKAKMLTVFPFHNRLCCIFPVVQLPLKYSQTETRLSFCLPRIKPPTMLITFDQKLLEGLSVMAKSIIKY